MSPTKSMAVAAALVLALAAPLTGCGVQTPDAPAQDQDQTNVATQIATIDIAGYDTTDLRVTSIEQTSAEEAEKDGVKSLTTSGTFEAANQSLEVSGDYTTAWSLSEDSSSWQEDSTDITVTGVKVLAGPSTEQAQELVQTNFSQIATAFGIGQNLIDSGAYTASGVTVTDVTFDEDAQAATAAVTVTGQNVYATDGTGSVVFAATDAGWQYDSASGDSKFEETYLGTWVGTLTSYEDVYMDEISDDGEWVTNTDGAGATATLTITSIGEPDVYGGRAIEGTISYNIPYHQLNGPSTVGSVAVEDTLEVQESFSTTLSTDEESAFIYLDYGNRLQNHMVTICLYLSDSDSYPYLNVEYTFPQASTKLSATFALSRAS